MTLRIWTGVCLLAALLAGCQATPLTQDQVVALSRMAYPKDAELGADLDIVVLYHRERLELVNRTPRAWNDVHLWLNQQYVSQPVSIAIGKGESQQNTLDLRRFIDKHRRPYPVGSLLAPDKAFPVVLAEVFDPTTGTRHRLVVRRPT